MAAESYRTQTKVPLPGSERKPFAATAQAARFVSSRAPSSTASDETVTVSVLVRRRVPMDPATFAPGAHLDHAAFDAQHGADPDAVAAVKAFAAEYGLSAQAVPDAGRRTLHLTGTPSQMEDAFGVRFTHHMVGETAVRTREGLIYIPSSLTGQIEAVLGLDARPQAKPHCRYVATPLASNVSYTPVQVGELYRFPAGITATGQTIGLIELGGGFRPADITAYFSSIHVAPPTVTAVLVDKAKNAPGDPNGADGEVMLDIEVAGAVAPGAAIAVYFAPNTDAGFLDAITTAVHDSTHKPGVLSISWGGPESTWTQQAMTAMEDAFQAAAALGVSVTVAAGDNGSSDGVTDGINHVDFPASSPHALACGGTKLTASGSTITSEVVWNEDALNEGATGGGVSTIFARPAYQAQANVPASGAGGRGVPDVAGDADPSTGYVVRVDGQTTVIGGTSAVAPLWAGLLTLANAANGTRAGFVNPTLYAATQGSLFRDITQGNNGAFAAAKGWDPCTGLGTPLGTAVIAALKAAASGSKA